MYQYQFKKSPLTLRQPQLPKQSHTLQHLLPPDPILHLTKHTKQKQKETHLLQDALIRKNDQIKLLNEKNNQLILIINQKEIQKSKLGKKYGELLELYEEVKGQHGVAMEVAVLRDENRLLGEKVRRLERELLEAEKEIVRKVKFYEDKNEDSRKLLQKLNQNLTKRQQKFKQQLQQCQTELRKKTTLLTKLQQQLQQLQSLHAQKQDQLTKILQETQRDRSAFSQNISTIQIKLQSENNRLNQDIVGLQHVIEVMRREYQGKLGEMRGRLEELERENLGLRAEVGVGREGLEEYGGRVMGLEIQCKELQGKCQLLELDNQQNIIKLEQKKAQLQAQKQKSTHLQNLLQTLQPQLHSLQSQSTTLHQTHTQLSTDLQSTKLQLQKTKQLLQQKLQQIAELELKLYEERNLNKKYCSDIEELDRYVDQLKVGVKVGGKKVEKLEELLESYKGEKVRVREQNESRWREMTQFYQAEINKLNTRLLAYQSKSTANLRISPTKHSNFLSIPKQQDYS